MDRTTHSTYPYPLPISRALHAASQDTGLHTPHSGLQLADALTYYLGAVAVGHYSRALLTGEIESDPTLNRSLRSLRRVLRGQWLLWVARGLAATPGGVVRGLAEWYVDPVGGALTEAYSTILRTLREDLGYTGEYGEREQASPRNLLELIDQLRIRLDKVGEGALTRQANTTLAEALISGLRSALEGASSLAEYPLYAPIEPKLLMGLTSTTPMPPLTAPPEAAEIATLLLFTPGEPPDYTKRPRLDQERQPLFPLDPLLAYLRCDTCDTHRVAALREVINGFPNYIGLDPECGHEIRGLRTEGMNDE